MSGSQPSSMEFHRRIGLFVGPIAALVVLVLLQPGDLPNEARYVAAIAVWMAIWWATEAINVAVTAFLPLVLFPLIGISPIRDTASSYAHPMVYLFMGGFIMALALEKSGLHHRFALKIFQHAGVNPQGIIGGFMVAAALISMWVSNTSTTLMMLPIATSIIYVVKESVSELPERDFSNFEVSVYLGLAYGATMGGIATLVGTPPNAFMSGFVEDNLQSEVDFARWMMVGVPIAAIMLPTIWLLFTKFLFPVSFEPSEGTRAFLNSRRKQLGDWSVVEKRTAGLFGFLVVGWIAGKPVADYFGIVDLTDAGIAMTAAVLAFLVPSGKSGQALMSWEDTARLPWGVLILFGGGLALAAGITGSGLSTWLGQLLAPLGAVHPAILIIVACGLVIFLTELTSNLATTATFLPIVAALGLEIGVDPLILIVPVTLAASLAFMLPVATPPNAIVFSSGRVSMQKMMRAGLILNIIGIVVLTIVALVLVPAVFG